MLVWTEYQRADGYVRLHASNGNKLEVPLIAGEPDPDLTPYMVGDWEPEQGPIDVP